jgi:hypothetical protein
MKHINTLCGQNAEVLMMKGCVTLCCKVLTLYVAAQQNNFFWTWFLRVTASHLTDYYIHFETDLYNFIEFIRRVISRIVLGIDQYRDVGMRMRWAPWSRHALAMYTQWYWTVGRESDYRVHAPRRDGPFLRHRSSATGDHCSRRR